MYTSEIIAAIPELPAIALTAAGLLGLLGAEKKGLSLFNNN